jgi:rRNA biogenesis protein RRP5
MSFSEIKEKTNLYTSLMNLEKKYGNEQTQEKVFKEAILYCNDNKEDIYISQAMINFKNEDIKASNELFEKILNKFKNSLKSWEAYLKYLFEKKEELTEINKSFEKGN